VEVGGMEERREGGGQGEGEEEDGGAEGEVDGY
jgi:hypothetical protein